MLDEVWACLRRAGVKGGCNVMLYRDLPAAGHVAVEVGVEVSERLPVTGVTGTVVMSALPTGLAAETAAATRLVAAAHRLQSRLARLAGRLLRTAGAGQRGVAADPAGR